MTATVALRPTMTLGEAFAAAVAAAGDASMTADGERATLREIDDRAAALAARLAAAGVEPGDHVAVLLPNGLRYVEAFFAVVRLGGVVVPLGHLMGATELAQVEDAVPVRASLCDPTAPGLGSVRLTATSDGWVGPDDAAPVDAVPGEGLGGDAVPRERGDVAAVFLTSGTTGAPKAVTLSHHQLVRPLVALQRLHASFFSGSAFEQAKRLATVVARHRTRVLAARGRQTWLATSQFRSMAGHQVMTGSLLLGHDLVTSRSFHPRRTLELVDAHAVNVLAGTPAVLELLLRIEDLSRYDLSSLLVIGVGGGPAAPDLVERAQRRFGCAVTVGYGSTELGGGVLATRLDDSRRAQAETVGRPFPGVEVRIVDDDGDVVADGETGELCCREDGAATWTRTGDLARQHDDGTVTIIGRKDDVIVRRGQNVAPAEIENVVASLPAVRRCAAVGVPLRADQQVWVFVEAHGGAEVVEAVRSRCRVELSPAKRPDRIRVVDRLPVNGYGEILRRELRDHATRELELAQRGATE